VKNNSELSAIGFQTIFAPVCRRYNCVCVTYLASCKTTSNASWNSCARRGPNLQATLAMWVWVEGLGKQTAKAGQIPRPNGSAWMILKLRKQTSKLAALCTAVLLHPAINLQAVQAAGCTAHSVKGFCICKCCFIIPELTRTASCSEFKIHEGKSLLLAATLSQKPGLFLPAQTCSDRHVG